MIVLSGSSFGDMLISRKAGLARLIVLFPISMMRQLFDIVNQAVEIPLRVHLALSSQGEPIESFVVPQITEHRLDDRDAPPIELASAFTVDRAPHALGVGHHRLMLLEERNLADRRLLGMAQAAFS